MGFIGSVFDLLFPPRCVFCRRILAKKEHGMCALCEERLPFTEGRAATRKGEFFEVCVTPFHYRDAVRESLLRYKFKGQTSYAGCYARILADCIRQELAGRYNLITWVPVSARRQMKRGYDQAMLLALATALELDDVAVETLCKTSDIPAQSTIQGEEKRRANVNGVYKVTDQELVTGRRILLIDDVVTTGATLSECSRTLLMSGAETVVCAALARA